jgi:ribonuclease P protein component
MNFTFGKAYKLCSKKDIETLYREGRDVKSFPFYLKYSIGAVKNAPFQIVLVVPKKKFRNATTRNQIRRYIREAIRLEKNMLEEKLLGKEITVSLFLVYAGDADISFSSAKKDVVKLFKKLIYDIEQNKAS